MRALDFWVGRWDVQNAAGQSRASSEITIVADGCAILERYTGLPGPAGNTYIGAGLHVFDQTEGGWRQLWSDNQLGAKLMSGKPSGTDIIYTWDVIEKGKRIPKRYTLSGSQPGQPRRVRQLGERSDDGGNTWTTEFDLRYVPASGG